MNEAVQKDILIAEDDKDDVDIFEIALKEVNIPYKLRHAENGDKLFILLKDKIPQILFLDINMPCKDGVACIVEIRKNREYDGLPVIVYTSSLYQRTIDECYWNGANLYVTKALTFLSLTKKLQKIFDIDWERHMYYPHKDQFILD